MNSAGETEDADDDKQDDSRYQKIGKRRVLTQIDGANDPRSRDYDPLVSNHPGYHTSFHLMVHVQQLV